MNNLTRHLSLGLAVLCLSGCFPEERFWWSPTGDRAIVAVDDKLHLVQADGELGEPLAGASLEGALVKTVSWLPNGRDFVFHRVQHIATWEEMRTLISAEEIAAVDQIMPVVLPLLEAATQMSKTTGSLEIIAQALATTQKKRFEIALQRIWQDKPAVVEELLKAQPKGEEIVAAMQKKGPSYDMPELVVFKLNAENEVLAVSLSRSLLTRPVMPKVSPKHPYVAFLKLDEQEENATLELLPLNGGSGMVVARNVAGTFDWMPDGRTLVFMAPMGNHDEKLQSIHRITVVQESGEPMKPSTEAQPDGSQLRIKAPDRLDEPVTLATAIMLNRPALQALPDGRVLFASQPATLPAVGTGPALEPRLYVIAADGKSVQPVPTAPGDLPTNLGYFVASPDGRHIAIVESETDALAVVETDTGKMQLISPPHPHWQCETLPAWKSATELTFAALDGSTKAPKWMLWSAAGGMRSLSDKWPAAATAQWLENKERK